VSQAAVSRAFTPGASIANGTRAKVLDAAQTLGYRPNLLARSLIKGRTGIIGVVIGSPRYPFFLEALAALSVRMSKADKHILVYTAEGGTTVDVLVEDLLQYRVDAVFLMAAGLSPPLAERCRNEGVPVISFNMRGAITVNGDNLGGGARIAEHLLAQGYRNLALMTGLEESITSREREAGFSDHLAAQGLPPPTRVVGRFDRETAQQAARELLSRTPRPDAIFCANDHMALAALEVARLEFGLEIGREFGVAGFGDIDLAAWPTFSLTTYSLPVEGVIDRVAEVLLDPEGEPTHSVIGGELKLRDSTRRG
jgi:DNA-binding LacI/PurR family transcriptional regulator